MKFIEVNATQSRLPQVEDERTSVISFPFLLLAGLLILVSYGVANAWYAVKELVQ